MSDETPATLIGRTAIVRILDKPKGARVRITGEDIGGNPDLVMTEVIGGQREVSRVGFRRRAFHRSWLTLMKEETP